MQIAVKYPDQEIVDTSSLAYTASEIAQRQPSPSTRRTYASVYKNFLGFLGTEIAAKDLTPAMVIAFRNHLEASGRSKSTVACYLSALRTLITALGADPAIRLIKSAAVARGEPRALTTDEYKRLLEMPDDSVRGKRDLLLLRLLGDTGLRRSEAAAISIDDIEERERGTQTNWWLSVPYAKRGRSRSIPLPQEVLDAISSWFKVRPPTTTDHLLVSLARTTPQPLTTRDIARIVNNYADQAGLDKDKTVTPHVLRHTFCTRLANKGVGIDVIRQLAGHADIRTTTIYTDTSSQRLEET